MINTTLLSRRIVHWILLILLPFLKPNAIIQFVTKVVSSSSVNTMQNFCKNHFQKVIKNVKNQPVKSHKQLGVPHLILCNYRLHLFYLFILITLSQKGTAQTTLNFEPIYTTGGSNYVNGNYNVGLAGAYNANVVKLTKETVATKYASQFAKGNVTIWNIGKKGWESLTKSGYKTDAAHKDIFLNLKFETVQVAAKAAMKAFENNEFDAIEIVYSQFRNAATQTFVAEPFLPIPKVVAKEGAKKSDFIFEPNKEQLINELMPKILNTQLFKAVLDGNASEHGARMTAMDKASENANELLKSLKLSYNRARQAAITTELTEIVSGAAALQG